MKHKRILLSVLALWALIISCNLPSSATPASSGPLTETPTAVAGGGASNPDSTSPTLTPIATLTATATLVPATDTPIPTATQCLPVAVANSPVNIRSGPGIVYEIIGSLVQGASVNIAGKNAENTWWYVDFPSGAGGHGWVSMSVVTSACVPATLAIIAAPPTPVLPTATPTLVPAAPTAPAATVFAVTSVSMSVSGSCPNFSYTVTVTTNGAGTVTLHRVRSDNATDTTPRTLVYAAAGSQSFSETRYFGVAGSSAWIDIYIDSPNNQQFGRATFTCP